MVIISSPFSGSVSSNWPIGVFIAAVYGDVTSSVSVSFARAVTPTVPSLDITRMVRDWKVECKFVVRHHTYLWAAGSAAIIATIIPPSSVIALILSERPSR